MHFNLAIFQIDILLSIFMIVGVIASSIGGALRATNAKMDITGAILLAFIAGNGGGTVRDLLLHSQIFWIEQQFYIWLTLFVGSITFICAYYKKSFVEHKNFYSLLITTDAMGLAAFCLAGVEKSLYLGQNNFISIIMGVWTAIGGGILADIISNRIPLVFSSELYLSVAFLGAVSYITLLQLTNSVIASGISAILMLIIRLLSVKFKWKLPNIN